MNSKEQLIQLEEALIATGLYGRLSAAPADEATWPQRLEALLKQMEKGKITALSAAESVHLSEYMAARDLMDAAPLEEVPEALLASVHRALETPAQNKESIVVRLLRNGLELVQGSLAGATLELAPLAATRRSAPAEAPPVGNTGSRIDLKLPAGRGMVHCSILQTSATEAMVSISLKNLSGNFQISLRKGDRLVGSHSGVRSERSVQFDRIEAGQYSIELKGAQSVAIPFSIV